MPSAADIVRDSINEFSRVQDWMELCKENSPETYHAMHKRYIELKVTLTSLARQDQRIEIKIEKR